MKHLQLVHQVRIFILLIATTITANSLFAQVTFTENFSSLNFPPPGWKLTTTVGTNLWSRVANGTNPTCTPHSVPGMARFFSFNAPSGRNQTLITPVIDYSNRGIDTPVVRLWVYRDTAVAGSVDSLTIFVNTIDTLAGATRIGGIARNIHYDLPDTVSAIGWYQYSFDVPAPFNTSTNYILIKGTSRHGNNIFVDDVQWVAYPPNCTGTPTAGIVNAGSTMICAGEPDSTILFLTGQTTGFSGIHYQWQWADSLIGVWNNFGSDASALNSGAIPMTRYFRCIVSCSFSSSSDTSATLMIAISTNLPPTVNVTPNNVSYCAGSPPVTLAASGAVTYSWAPASGLDATTGDSVHTSPAGTTGYLVTGIDSAGCSDTALAIIVVHPSPVINMTATPDTICSGSSSALHAAVIGLGISYTWNPGGDTTATDTVNPAVTRTYSVTATITSTGCSATDSIRVHVVQLPVAAFSFDINNLTVTFQDSSLHASHWLWLFGNGDTSNLQTPVYSYGSAGIDTVSLIVSNGICPPDTISEIINLTPSGIATLNDDFAIDIYPNPVGTSTTIEFNMNETQAQLSLINSLGQTEIKRTVKTRTGNHFQEQLDMSTMGSGIYIVSIKTSTQNIIQKFVKL